MKSFFVVCLILFWAFWVIITHPQNAIVSWDEGFHGGAAFYISESLRNNFNFVENRYILNDFKNGIIFYLPLWWASAGLIGAIIGPSLEIYRATTTLFSIASLLLVFYFLKQQSGFKAALIAVVTLAFTPIFVVYSHLMMIEVPLLFSVSLALIMFYRYLTKPVLTRKDLIITAIAFFIGVMTKITAIALIFGVILAYGLVVRFLFKGSLIYKRYFSKPTAFFLLVSLLTFYSYKSLTLSVLSADMLVFYLNQMQDLSGHRGDFFASVWSTIKNFSFYLNDFRHMTPLATLWFGSLLSYILLKRSEFGFYLLTWTIVTYTIFSSVRPQAVQYVLPIFVPLSIATGLFWAEFLRYRSKFLSDLLFIILISSIAWIGQLFLKNTETYFWRTMITNQQQAVSWLVKNANESDRILSSGDGTRFLIRLQGQQKKLQTINAPGVKCAATFTDSSDWAISDFGPQNPIRLEEVKKQNWEEMISFNGEVEDIKLFKNNNNLSEVILKNESLTSAHCSWFLKHGKNKFIVSAEPVLKKSTFNNNSNVKIQLRVNPTKVVTELSLDEQQLLSEVGMGRNYVLEYDQRLINQPIYLSFETSSKLGLKLNKLEIIHSE